ncbi:MAG: hypothetical protein LBC72_02730 [Spirochaetaceae bacterium]|nr:hypothetical protein [Spirochaetaceae bacterium]
MRKQDIVYHFYMYIVLVYMFAPPSPQAPPALLAQSALQAQAHKTPYQIPSDVYVGDIGKLVYPLDDFFLHVKDSGARWDDGYSASGVTILAAELDRGGKALIITFQAWRAGLIVLPAITLGGEELSGIHVRVKSVLDIKDVSLVLAPPENPLLAPGSLWLLIAAVFAVLAPLCMLAFACMYGKSIYKAIVENAKIDKPRRVVLRNIKKYRRNMEKGSISAGEFLAALCRDFRAFISILHAVECDALTSAEFRFLDIAGSGRLARLLREADALRFSGSPPPKEAALRFAGDIVLEVDTQCENVRAGRRRDGEGAR